MPAPRSAALPQPPERATSLPLLAYLLHVPQLALIPGTKSRTCTTRILQAEEQWPRTRSVVLLSRSIAKGIRIPINPLEVPLGIAEVVGQLVDHRLADLGHELPPRGKVVLQRTLVNNDAV